MFDRDMRYIAVSRRWVTDYRLGDILVLGRSHYEVFPEVPERWKDMHRRGLEGHIASVSEDYFERSEGPGQWLRWEVRPWFSADGSVGGIVIFAADITERKQA